MDVVRPASRRIAMAPLWLTLAVAALAAAGWSSMRLLHPEPALPVIERATVVTDVARFGTLVRSVPAAGAFVANRVVVVPAPSDGFVDVLAVRPGAHVTPGTPIAHLRNADLDAAIAQLDAEIDAARAELQSVADQAEAASIAERTTVRSARADRQQAEAQAAVDESLHAQGLIGDLPYRIARIKVAEARDREHMGESGIRATLSDGRAKVAAQEAKIAALVGQRAAKATERGALAVTAGLAGVVQTVAVEPGARVSAGTELARVAADGDLEAVLQVAESDARLVFPGLRVALTADAGRLKGHVVRIDPAVVNGTIPVHVALDGSPAFARPSMHVDGAIELERIAGAVSIARPAGAGDDAALDLYLVEPGGATARRVRVRLGHGSLDRVQVRSGLSAGATVIVSDTSSAGDAPRIALH